MVDGKHRKPTDPLPDPFGQPGKYTIQFLFESTVKNTPSVFCGKLTSNTKMINVEMR